MEYGQALAEAVVVEGVGGSFDPTRFLRRSNTDVLMMPRAVGGCNEGSNALVCLVKVNSIKHAVDIVSINMVRINGYLGVRIPSGGEYVW